MKTTFENKCKILGDFGVAYNDDETWANFVRYANFGLHLSLAIDLDMVKPNNDRLYKLIDETWYLFLRLLEVEDRGYEDLEDLIPVGEEYL